jgi:hypothetical protein
LLRLKRTPYPDPVGTAAYFWVHAGHRETAINHAILVIRDSSVRELAALADDPIMAGLAAPMGEWAIESLIQGAWMREYHEWEKATKSYFEGQHLRGGTAKPDWKGKLLGTNKTASHVDRVRAQLSLFSAVMSESTLATLDEQRERINTAKHEGNHFATEQDYGDLVHAVSSFWNELAPQEEFTIAMPKHA